MNRGCLSDSEFRRIPMRFDTVIPRVLKPPRNFCLFWLQKKTLGSWCRKNSDIFVIYGLKYLIKVLCYQCYEVCDAIRYGSTSNPEILGLGARSLELVGAEYGARVTHLHSGWGCMAGNIGVDGLAHT